MTPIVFVAGLHRSATSLLARCLADHPEVTALSRTGVPEDEGQHLQDVYPTARQLGGPGRFGFRPRARMDETSPRPRDARERLLRAWSPHWDADRPVRVEKSPPNLLRTRFLQSVFPEASFVVMVRHPVAVSMATQKWTHTPLASLIRHWLVCHEAFLEDAPSLARLRVVRYEDLVADPSGTVAGLHRFLGLVPHPVRQDVREGADRRYFERWERKRRRPLAGPYFAWLLDRYEERVGRFGWSLDRPGPARHPWPAAALAEARS